MYLNSDAVVMKSSKELLVSNDLLENLIICNSDVKSPFVDYVRNEN